MPSASDNLSSLALSADDLRMMTEWPDALVEDYLTIIRNFSRVADYIDGEVMSNISSHEAKINMALQRVVRLSNENSSQFDRRYALLVS